MHTGSNRLSRYVFICCAALMCYASFFFYPRWKHDGTEAAISYDVSGYYWYLPSIFIYHDLKHQSFKDSILNKYQPTNQEFMQGFAIGNGNYVMKYSSGMAVMYLPFFTAAHLLAGALGYPRDGFSHPYQFAIQFGGLLMSLIGLWYLRKLLLNFYSDKVVAITLALLVFGTNYLNYSSIDCGMSHTWLFTVYVFLLLNTLHFYQSFKIKYALRIGLLVGLATLTRPTDAISCLIPLLWGMNSISAASIKKQVAIIAKNYKALLLACGCAALVACIQFVYWKYVSGHWVVYSYQEQRLYFRSPNFVDYTFSYRSGWLTYSPMMALAFLGIIPFVKNGANKVAIMAFFLLNYYLVCAWNIWWYGGRAMMQSYPVLMFCIAALVDAAMTRKIIFWICAPIAFVFVYFNAWVTYAYHRGNLFDTENMPAVYFWRVAGRWNPPARTALLKDDPDLYEGKPKNERLLNRTDTASTTIVLDKNHQNSPAYKFPFTGDGMQWLRATATFHCNDKEYEGWNMAQFILRVVRGDSIIKERVIKVYRQLGDHDTKTISVDMQLPTGTYDHVNVLLWNGGSDKPLWMQDLKVEAFNE